MSPEMIKILRSRPFPEIGEPSFTKIERYEKDASNAIAIGALLSGDVIILKEIERSGRVYYWLKGEKYPGTHVVDGITYRFEGIKEDRRWVFTRFRDSEKVLLGKIGVTKLVIQRNLTNRQIKRYGYLYGVPDKVMLSKQLKEERIINPSV